MKEIIFRVEIDAGCGYRARAVYQDIFTQGRTIEEIKAMVLEALNVILVKIRCQNAYAQNCLSWS
jgi:hypothetical protein